MISPDQDDSVTSLSAFEARKRRADAADMLGKYIAENGIDGSPIDELPPEDVEAFLQDQRSPTNQPRSSYEVPPEQPPLE
jgi:hypothetical protein